MADRADDPSAVVKLTRIIGGAYLPRAVQVAARLGLGEILANGPLRTEEIAQRTSTDPDALRLLLRVLSEYEILQETEQDVFGPTHLSNNLRFIDDPSHGEESASTWGGLLDAVRTGRPAFEAVHGAHFFEWLTRNPEFERNWNDWNTVSARVWLPPIIDALNLGGTETVVDVGGGQGNLLAELLQRLPGCRGVLVDLPTVVAGADRLLRLGGLAERVTIVPGDVFRSVPAGGDAYVVCRVLFNWDRARRLALLRRCREAVAPSARLLIVEFAMPERGDPTRKFYAANDLNLWLTFGGSIPSRAEWNDLLADAGFTLQRITDPVSSVGWQVLEASPT